MNDDTIADLKQFITASVSGQIKLAFEEQLPKHLKPIHDRLGRLENKVDNLEITVDRIEKKMDDGFAGIAEIIDRHNTQLDDHDTRISKLETQTVA